MRKLTYEIFDRQGNKIKEVNTYKELEAEKAKGNYFKSKLTELVERGVYEIYKGKEKIAETSLIREMLKFKKEGYTVKTVTRVF